MALSTLAKRWEKKCAELGEGGTEAEEVWRRFIEPSLTSEELAAALEDWRTSYPEKDRKQEPDCGPQKAGLLLENLSAWIRDCREEEGGAEKKEGAVETKQN